MEEEFTTMWRKLSLTEEVKSGILIQDKATADLERKGEQRLVGFIIVDKPTRRLSKQQL